MFFNDSQIKNALDNYITGNYGEDFFKPTSKIKEDRMAYVGFKKLEGKLKKQGVKDPGAVAASIGRKKFGKEKFQKAAAAGKSLRNAKPLKKSK